ncbi:FAD-binding oxidoreductase [Cognatishimia sp. F0-27]|nr:FAD-binding oxidoreductase [Cognatishimia sp. F0-27]
MHVTRLPRDPGPAGWNRLLPDPPPPTPLDGRTTSDWVIIGAGFAGLAAARRLSQLCPGDRITVLEAARVADGPAGRNSGFMIDVPHDLSSRNYSGASTADRLQIADNRHAIAFAAAMARDFGLSEEVFRQCGKINGAATARGTAHNASFARHLDALGEPSTWLDAGQMRAITGSDYYESGLFTPGCAMLQPAAFVRGVAYGMQSNRLVLHENSPVIRLYREGDWIAETPQGRVTAPRVILAVNGHLESFGHARGRLMHVFTYASMTRRLRQDDLRPLGGEATWGLTPADPMGTTVRRVSGTGGDRLVVRNRFTFNPSLAISEAELARAVRDHDRSFANRFPQLAGIEMEYRWGGRLCLSRNGVQVIAELEENLWSACCQQGLGTAKGTLAGMLAAEAATNTPSERLTRALAADRPARLPPAPIARLGARMRIAWDERRAGREL